MFSNRLIDAARSASKIAVLTGAGISAESGVPIFRGENGLWKKFRPEELANVHAFMQNPQLVWEWYLYRRKLIDEVQPNPGHFALVNIERIVPEFWLITQNVDGLHRKSGSEHILELHGNIMHNKCMECGEQNAELYLEFEADLPRCSCGGLMRPDVVWYGEMLPESTLQQAFHAAENCDLFLSIGTSAVVQPAASLPLVAKRAGAFVVEVNMEPTVISGEMDESLLGPSGEILPQLFKQVWESSTGA